jgi:outer membrane protein assembly factor BamE (lipoprotein component of BamABCDE complex)
MTLNRRFLVLGAALLALAACSRGPKPEKQPAANATPPPADSPLAKVKTGMTEAQVLSIMGQPSDQGAYITGKAFIPWYFGSDTARVAYYYKGQGRVVFAAGGIGNRAGTVQRVEYDPNEDGVR